MSAIGSEEKLAGHRTSSGDRRAHKSVELLVSADGELQMARCDALDFQVLGRIPYNRR